MSEFEPIAEPTPAELIKGLRALGYSSGQIMEMVGYKEPQAGGPATGQGTNIESTDGSRSGWGIDLGSRDVQIGGDWYSGRGREGTVGQIEIRKKA